MIRFQSRFVFWLLALTALTSGGAAAQSLATLTGTVTDMTGGVIVGSTVAAFVDDVLVSTTTQRTRPYLLSLPSDGAYRIVVRAKGFVVQTVDMTLAGDVHRDFELGIAPLDDTIVVTPSGVPESRAAITESLTVFDSQDIHRAGASSLADIVGRVPGLHVEANGREGALTSLFARGGESDYNHVLIDGVRVNISGGQFDLSRISAGDIDRVEVVHGAQSALYGSDAIGSVIQVFTNRALPAEPPQVSGSIEGGSFGTWRGNAWLAGGWRERIDYQLGIAYRGTEGAFSDILVERDRYDQTSINGGLGIALGGGASLRTGFRFSDARGRAVGQIAYGPGDRGTREETEDLTWHFQFDHQLTPVVHHSAAATFHRWNRLSADEIIDPSYNVYAILSGQPGARFPDGPQLVRQIDRPSFDALADAQSSLSDGQFLAKTPFSISDFPGTFTSAFRRPALRYRLDLTWLATQVLSVGYEYEQETDPLQNFRVTAHAYFAQQQLSLADRWHVAIGGRIDSHSHYGTEISPKLSAGGYPVLYRTGRFSSMKVFTNIGKGIKNPAFSELFGSAFVNGNPNLRPEQARTVDAGLELTFDSQRWLSRVTFFDNTFTNQVAFQFSPGFGGDGLPDFLNINGSDAQGVEIEISLQRPVAGFAAHIGYSLVDTRVVSTASSSDQFQPGQPLLRRPRHSGSAQVTYSRGRSSLQADVRSIGQRHDSSFLGLVRVSDGRPVEITVNPSYTVIGLGGQFRLDDDLTVYVRFDNVSDTSYESALGYPGLPRSVTFGGRLRIGQ